MANKEHAVSSEKYFQKDDAISSERNIHKEHALSSETFLKGEYQILRCIGQGGFSFTYLANCASTDRMVVVKELFNDSYMERLPGESSIHILDDSLVPMYERDRKHFQNEWELMNRFASSPGIAAPLDFFEDNNTVYLVMEHLPGGSLKENVPSKGSFRADALMEKMSDVLQLLEAMHKGGYVHGDISPDNLVLDDKGKFRLIDFGAARTVGSTVAANDLIHKEGYTPAEVFQKNYKAAPSSDIYSLCAAFYFALTGRAPEDALERFLIDEVQPLSVLLPEEDQLITQLVDRGLSMSPEARWKDAGEIRILLDEYKESAAKRAEEEEALRKKKKKRRALIGAAVVFAAAIAVLVFCMTHRALIKFRGKETQTIAFYYDQEITAEDLETLRGNIEQKAEDIAGADGYLMSTSEGIIELTLPYDYFEGIDIANLLNKYFNFNHCVLRIYKNNTASAAVLADSDLIEQITNDENSCTLSLTAAAAKSLSEAAGNASGADIAFSFIIYTDGNENYLWDSHGMPYGGAVYELSAEFDSDSGEFVVGGDAFESAYAAALFADCLSQESVPIESFNYSRKISWEEKQETTWGGNQVDPSRITGEAVLLEYSDDADDSGYNILNYTLYDSEVENDGEVIPLKKRLDALEIPYACGWDENNKNELYVKVSAKDIWEIEAALLFCETDEFFLENVGEVRSASGIIFPDIDPETPYIVEDGCVRVKLGDTEKLEEVTSRMEENGEDTVQLCLDGRPVFETSTANIDDEGWISFDKSLLGSSATQTGNQDLDSFVGYVNALVENPFSFSVSFAFRGALYTDHSGIYNWKKNLWDLDGCEVHTLKTEIEEYCEEKHWETRCMDSFEIDITCDYDEEIREEYPHPYAFVAEFLQQFELTSELEQIHFYIYESGDLETACYEMSISSDAQSGETDLAWDIYHTYGSDAAGMSDAERDQLDSSDRDAAIQYLSAETAFSSCNFDPALQ